MAFNVNELNVIRSYIAATGEAPNQEQLAAAFNYSSLNALARDLTQGNTQSNEDFVKAMYTNLLGRAADAEGLEYWTSLMSASQGLNALSKAAVTTAFQWAAANAEDETGLVDGTAGLTPVGGAFPTGGDDTDEPGTGEPGTEYQDTFVFDTEIGRSDVSGWSHNTGDTAEGAVGDVDGATAITTADYESKTHKIFNIGKEAIDNGINTISADYTFKVENQLGDQGKYEGYFLSPILDNTTTNLGAVLTLEIIDRMAEANNKADALSLVAIESFSFYLNGEQKVIGSQAILNATTYEELRDAIAAELTAQGLTNVSVALGADFTRQQVDADDLLTTGANVLGTQIILTAAGNSVIERGGFAFGERAGVDRNVDPSGRQDTTALGSSSTLISTNIELQNVGYGSQGGSINISGQSNSNMGVEQFDVEANAHGNTDLGVWLTELSSNPLKDAEQNALKVVNVTGGAKYFHVGTEQAAALRNNDGAVAAGKVNAGLTDVRLFNATQFAGNVKINAQITDNVIERDLNLVDTAGNPATDNVTYTYNTSSGHDQLILSVSQSVIAHEDAGLSINTGAGNDYVHLTLDNDDNAPSNWQANQNLLKNIVVNAGSGNNTVWTEGSGSATILTGGGADTIYTDNSGSSTQAYFNTFVAAPATATQAEIDALKALGLNVTSIAGAQLEAEGALHARWVVNAGNVDILDLQGNALTNTFLYKGKLTVTFNPTGAAVAGTTGFESVAVDIPTTRGVMTEANYNQAIKKAINEDAVLRELLVAKDGPANTLIIESLVDGTMAANAIQFSHTAPLVGDLTAQEVTEATTWFQEFSNDSGAALVLPAAPAVANPALAQLNGIDIAGTPSTASGENTVNSGAGNDVIVLSTNSDADTIVFNTGSIGNNTIANYEQGTDTLDFTAWLDVTYSVSGSTGAASQARSTTVFDGTDSFTAPTPAAGGTGASAGANMVSVLDFTVLNVAATNALAFWDASAATDPSNFETLLSLNSANLATLLNAALDTTALDGTATKNIIMIESGNNDGKYAVIQASTIETHVDAANALANVSLIGTIDLGESGAGLTLAAADFA